MNEVHLRNTSRTESTRAITEVAAEIGLSPEDLRPFGRHMAKLEPAALGRLRSRPPGRIVLVSAINPTRAGEGKTTVSIGLAQGLRRLGKRAALALREPSLGPVFGIKGGGTGGGRCRLEPSARINLHFTGDLHAVTAAHNLLAALVDNAINFGDVVNLDSRQVLWRRVLDMNDRCLREIVIGLGGPGNGVPREAAFDITAASEVMAVLCLAEGVADLKRRLGQIIVGFDHAGGPVTAARLGAVGPMAALLQDALLPNLVQSSEGVPAFVHGGPFGNIAHGCNSVLATRAAAGAADYAVTEAGFGFDLGAEKFFDIKCRSAGIWPDAVVLVTTVRALKVHGAGELRRGLDHLDHHVGNVRVFGFEPVVALNVFPDDTAAELAAVEADCAARGLAVARSLGFSEGGTGCLDLAARVVEACGPRTPAPRFLYPLDAAPEEKLACVARTIYGAREVVLSREARRDLDRVRTLGFAGLPVCVAKTHLSLSDDPAVVGRPHDHLFRVRALRIAAGAGYLLALAGDIVTMPGLPARPAATAIDLSDDGEVIGLG
jgi:formate--tetrahydrofolate ligase